MRRHTVFRDNPYSHTVVFPDDYPLPDAADIQMQVRKDGRILPGITPSIAVDGKRVTFTYDVEDLQKLPTISQQYMVLDGVSLIGGELGVLIGVGEQDISETTVNIVDGQVTAVEVQGLALVDAQVTIATQKAAEATEGATTATAKAQEAVTGATTATTKASEAVIARDAAVAAKEEAEQILAQKMDLYKVASKAALDAFIQTPSLPACGILVLADETYTNLPRLYVFTGTELIQFITYSE